MMKVLIILMVVGVLGAAGVSIYLFNKPHRDVQGGSIDFKVTHTDLVRQYLTNPQQANQKYMGDKGNSSILAVTGNVHSISRDLNDQSVVLLKNKGEKAGVSCTFLPQTDEQIGKIGVGQSITVKGVIRSGARYDEDLDLYEDVILEKCSLL